ncbi:AraC family transcriptional regulator [bacterium]|jgi:AraC-like DNA-binding protein/mannose-6-phosphate isomerase-like protein (cupin superfamily)|nr:AraC family transcriptional regulator [bacterium]|tara:strand:- start:13631 stop:14500 length:870 start_codon:yes stop_codon:yes gene_type:complete
MKATIENIKIAEKDRSYNSYILKQKKSDYRQTVFTDYWHYHPEIEITYIIKGNGLAFIGNKTIEFGPGQAFLLGPYLPHNFIGTDEEGIVLERECWGLQFTTEWLYSIKESAALQRLFNAMSFGINLGQLRALEHQAFSSIVGDDPLRSIGSFFNLMAMIAERPDLVTVSTNSAYSNVMSKKLSQRMERVSKHIQANYQRAITLNEIADIASMTEQSFSRWFRQTSGLTFIDYLMQLRTTVASHLLINTSKPMTEVATESGFNSSSSFNRAFLKIKGCSPREFRKRKRV